MNSKVVVSDQLAFGQIDPELIAILREGKEFIIRELPTVLDDFYNHIAKFPGAATFFKNREMMAHAKAMQLRHWGIILDGQFDEAYRAAALRVGEVHHNLGLEPNWYIGGCSYLVAALVEVIARKMPARMFDRSAADRKIKLQQAIVKVAMLDMDFVLAVYLSAGKREREQTLNRLVGDFDKTISRVTESVASASTQLLATADAMSKIADETSAKSQSAVNALEATSSNMHTAVRDVENLSASFIEINHHALQSARIAGVAAGDAGHANDKVQGLAEMARTIGDIVQLIGDVASQTNLLALNATIESARAGPAGRGFSVVAREVKLLAEQTANAASEIATQVKSIQTSTDDTASEIGGITEVIMSINHSADTVVAVVEQKIAVTQKITGNMQQVAESVSDVSASTADVARAAGETGVAASQLLVAAASLSDEAKQLSDEMIKFRRRVLAA